MKNFENKRSGGTLSFKIYLKMYGVYYEVIHTPKVTVIYNIHIRYKYV